jgi:phosphoglycolate phosphatase-like HAD superfamily hydrolase
VSTFVLWDIDGTLIYNGPKAGTLYLDSIEQVTGIRPTVRVGSPHGMTEGQLLAAILEVNGIDVSLVPEVYSRLEVLSLAEHEAGALRERCIGVDVALAAVADRGWHNALLTGNGPNRARYKVVAAGIDESLFDWENSFFGHEAPTRHHLTATARATLADRAAVIIGDTPKDGEAADSAGIPFIAVATGAFSADELRETSALVVVDDFRSGLDDVLEAIASLPARP